MIENIMNLSRIQKSCLAYMASRGYAHLQIDPDNNRWIGFFKAATIDSLVNRGLIKASSYYRQYVLTDDGTEVSKSFRKKWKENG